jgi:hypothetical protein
LVQGMFLGGCSAAGDMSPGNQRPPV